MPKRDTGLVTDRVSIFGDRSTPPVHTPFTEEDRAILREELLIFGACDEGFRRVALRTGRHMFECREEHRRMLGVKPNLVIFDHARGRAASRRKPPRMPDPDEAA